MAKTSAFSAESFPATLRRSVQHPIRHLECTLSTHTHTHTQTHTHTHTHTTCTSLVHAISPVPTLHTHTHTPLHNTHHMHLFGACNITSSITGAYTLDSLQRSYPGSMDCRASSIFTEVTCHGQSDRLQGSACSAFKVQL